jgi:diguanylate cyclase (GGDEF)-like protein
MDTIEPKVLKICLDSQDDNILLKDIQSLIEIEGDKSYPIVFRLLANLTLPQEEAKRHWLQLLAHRQSLLDVIKRPMTLVTVLCDYLSNQDDLDINPKLVDIKSFEHVIRSSTHDALTGLLNRNYFEDTLSHQLGQAERFDSNLSLLFIDIDDFKEVNDEYGHVVGDNVIRRIAEIIRAEIRQSDLAIRYGGEEFVVLMPGTASIDALVLAERIRTSIAKSVLVTDAGDIQMSISGGVATYPVEAKNKEELVYFADSALYISKGAGKNRISVFKEDKRRFMRIDVNKPVRIRPLDFNSVEEFSGVSKDIGIGGILFENSSPFDLGTKVQLTIQLNQKDPTLLIGTVVRVELTEKNLFDIGMALSFRELDKIVRSEITQVLMKNDVTP